MVEQMSPMPDVDEEGDAEGDDVEGDAEEDDVEGDDGLLGEGPVDPPVPLCAPKDRGPQS